MTKRVFYKVGARIMMTCDSQGLHEIIGDLNKRCWIRSLSYDEEDQLLNVRVDLKQDTQPDQLIADFEVDADEIRIIHHREVATKEDFDWFMRKDVGLNTHYITEEQYERRIYVAERKSGR